LASTHGDHTVKITCTSTGKLIRNLEGHPRTPWTVKYHPKKPHIVASGCLGYQVRVWDWNWRSEGWKEDQRKARRRRRRGVRSWSPRGVGQYDTDDYEEDEEDEEEEEYEDTDYSMGMGVCLTMIRLQYAIISLAFHPSGKMLAVASGSTLHLWDYDDYGGKRKRKQEAKLEANGTPSFRSTGSAAAPPQPRNRFRQNQPRTSDRGGIRTEMRHEHALRCVHFPPSGKTIIVGGVNPQNETSRGSGMSGGGMSFSLRLWDFDLEASLCPGGMYRGRSGGLRREPMSNARTFVPRALLYNDGGFDVSPDGKTLCACAEYWLPEGVDNAMDILDSPPSSAAAPPPSSVEDGNKKDATAESSSSTLSSESSSVEPMNDTTGTTTTATRSTSASSNMYSSPPRQRSIGGGGPPPPIAPQPPAAGGGGYPVTPPNTNRTRMTLSPPSPPGRRWPGGLHQRGGGSMTSSNTNATSLVPRETGGPVSQRRHPPSSSSRPYTGGGTTGRYPYHHPQLSQGVGASTNGTNSSSPPPPPSPPLHQPHPLAIIDDGTAISSSPSSSQFRMSSPLYKRGRYVPHIVTVSLEDSAPIPIGTTQNAAFRHEEDTSSSSTQPHLGQILEASPLDGTKASGVTCVKFSPSAEFCLLGYGVRESSSSSNGEEEQLHPVTALYRIQGGLAHVSTMLSGDDDVNIARFHPESGYGFVYGTKQGRVRVLSPRPWNYYHP